MLFVCLVHVSQHVFWLMLFVCLVHVSQHVFWLMLFCSPVRLLTDFLPE